MSQKRKAKSVLVAARALLAQPYTWGKGQYERKSARSACGKRYCAKGAIWYGVPNATQKARKEAALTLDAVSIQVTEDLAVFFNDRKDTKLKDVLALYDRAIEAAS